MSELLLIDMLLDEDTDRDHVGPLEEQGHDVERVVDVGELGPGTDDDDVFEYAENEDRVIITYDEGFFKRVKGEEGPLRLLWFTEQQRFRADEEAQMIENVLTILSNREDAPRAIPVNAGYFEMD